MAKNKRYFRHDVFLSHNQKDGSLVLRDELLKRSVKAWHDGDADMSDRNVLEIVLSALDASRFICVCVSQTFRDSDWVRSEYQRGLELTRKSGACCVIVAEMTPGAQIPRSLQDQPRFRLYADGIDPLAAYVRAANHRTPIDGERFVPDADRLRRDGVKLRSLNGLREGLSGISDDERAKLLLGNLRSAPIDPQLPAFALIRVLERAQWMNDRRVLLDIYDSVAARDDILAEASRSHDDDQHRPLETLLHPLTELAQTPADRDRASALHDHLLSRVAALHHLDARIVQLFRRYHDERLAGRWVDTRRPAPKSRPARGLSAVDIAITMLGGAVLLAGIGIMVMMFGAG